jgi:hypothetical protein
MNAIGARVVLAGMGSHAPAAGRLAWFLKGQAPQPASLPQVSVHENAVGVRFRGTGGRMISYTDRRVFLATALATLSVRSGTRR